MEIRIDNNYGSVISERHEYAAGVKSFLQGDKNIRMSYYNEL